MKKSIIVISLGGSLIVPENVDYKYLEKFSKIIKHLGKTFKIIIVTGGGKTARKYIDAVRRNNLDEDIQSLVGIMSTKLNARLVAGFLKIKTSIPDSLEEVKKILERNDLIICGALGFHPNRTSDSTAAEIASYMKANFFINLTDVDGLYDKDPKCYKSAKLIHTIDYNNFLSIVKKIKYESGQHFVLDQVAAKIINRDKIKTIIINGHDIKNMQRCLKGDVFTGTTIS